MARSTSSAASTVVSSAQVTATATFQNGLGSASNMRSSSQPLGRTGGNSVVRW